MTIRPIIAAFFALSLSACATYGDGYDPYYDNAYGGDYGGWYVGGPVGGYAYSYDPFYDASYHALYGYGWTPTGYYALYGRTPNCYNPGFGRLYANPCGYGYGYGYAGFGSGPGYGYWNNFFLYANQYGNDFGHNRDRIGHDRKKNKKKGRSVREGGPSEWDDEDFQGRRTFTQSTPTRSIQRSGRRPARVAPTAGRRSPAATTQRATQQPRVRPGAQPNVQPRVRPGARPNGQQRVRPSARQNVQPGRQQGVAQPRVRSQPTRTPRAAPQQSRPRPTARSSGPRPTVKSAPRATPRVRSRSNSRPRIRPQRPKHKNR